jgi:23S rRNA (uridine2552-2'-O)-methyltransferase
MDLLPIKPIPGVEFYQGDFTTDEALEWLENRVKSEEYRVENSETASRNAIDVVLSDMAPNTTGHQKTDHLRQMTLLEYAFDFAARTLRPGGAFVAKSFTGGTTPQLLAEIKKQFAAVHHVKPDASRKDSVEMFIVATGYNGA